MGIKNDKLSTAVEDFAYPNIWRTRLLGAQLDPGGP
jgi:hypothetical protein